MKRAAAYHLQSATRGFALVITLALLALLMLAVLALGTLARVSSRIAATSKFQTQARQHALLGLETALGALQQHAGGDDRITAMAGVTGVSAGASSATRHWCGVWTTTGGFVGWLVSGAEPGSSAAIQSGLARLALVSAGSVGAPAANSEHVDVGIWPIEVIDPLSGRRRVDGNFAYWVGDEGVKISAYAPDAELALAGVHPVLGSNPATSATAKLGLALATYGAKLPRVVTYEQLGLLPTPGAPLAASVLQDSFHHTTLTSRGLVSTGGGPVLRAGIFNPNTTSQIAWRGLLETYNSTAAGPPIAAIALGTSPVTSLPARIANNLALAGEAGKLPNGPFLTVAAFAGSGLLSTALAASGSGVTPEELITGIGPLLAVRSDTFRVRAGGEVLDPVDEATVRAVAYVEAIVQRVPAAAPNALGRRFRIIHFRWLGLDDL